VRRLAGTALAFFVLAPAAVAATEPGEYTGSLYQNGSKVKNSLARVVVNEAGDRFLLGARRMKLRCPGEPKSVRLRLLHKGVIAPDGHVDDARLLEGGNNQVRVIGQFTSRRFSGTIKVTGAPGVEKACTGTARVRVAL
jgi:hypothetical protein